MSYFDDNEDRIIYGHSPGLRRRERRRDVYQVARPPVCTKCGILVFFNGSKDMYSDPMCTVRHSHVPVPSADDFEDLS